MAWVVDSGPVRPETGAGGGSVGRLGGDQAGGGPLAADRGGRRLGQARDRGGLGDVRRVHGVGATHLGGEQPDDATTDQVGQGVHECVDQVAVVITPPEQYGVHDVAVGAVHHVGVDRVLALEPQTVSGVFVTTE